MERTLFGERGISHDWFAQRMAAMKAAVGGMPAARILGESIDDLVAEVAQQYSVATPRLTGDRTLPKGAQDIQIDVANDWMRAVTSLPGSRLVPGHLVEVHERFEGEPALVDVCPSTHDLNPPRGDVRGSEIVVSLTIQRGGLNNEQIVKEVEDRFTRIGLYMERMANDARGFNNGLPAAVRQVIEQRRQHLEVGQSLEAALGLPVKRRPDADPSLAVEVPRRRPLAVGRPAATPPSPPGEPFLSDADYQGIIEFLGTIRRLIERLPETFSLLPEESLRDVLLVILNNTFGQTTGESFSGKGKTDILVATDRGPVFIAECKFWGGQKAFGDALEQLLGYLVWRDTKAAMVLFVREKDVTTITERALQVLRQHPQFVRGSAAIGGDPTVVLHHAGDRQRLVRVALIVVPVPPSS